jgi:acetyl esterase/lipase
MKKTNLLLLVLLATCTLTVQAQRYLTPQFSATTVNTIAYGTNYTVLAAAGGHTLAQPLVADVYRPATDTVAKRPLVIYLHTGNFLPFPQNQGVNGTRGDSTCIEICTRLAKMGYVAASADYRLGWNPFATDVNDRSSGLINAAYRGLQDARTAVRYFKANAATFGIDSTKIVVWGQGTGGYIALAVGTLDSYNKILTTTQPAAKFFDSRTTPARPMVIEQIAGFGYVNGDIEGKFLGRLPAAAGPLPAGDTLNLPNWVANTSNVQMIVNMGGALGDISWLTATSIPTISFHVPYDPFAPYNSSVLNVNGAGTPLPVVEVQGGNWVQRKVDELGLDNAYDNVNAFWNPHKALFASRAFDSLLFGNNVMRIAGTNRFKGLFPLLGDTISDSSPWDFWASTNVNNANGLQSNPRMTPAKAKRYIDTIMTVFAPRACITLNLPCKTNVTNVSTEELLAADTKLVTSPNPSHSSIKFESDVYNPIQRIDLYDMSGKLMQVNSNINNHTFQLERNGLPTGMYIAKVKFEGGILAKKVIFE